MAQSTTLSSKLPSSAVLRTVSAFNMAKEYERRAEKKRDEVCAYVEKMTPEDVAAYLSLVG